MKARAEASKEDNPNWKEAMLGPFKEEFWKAAMKEIVTLEEMGAWTVVDREEGMNVIDSIWAFKLKRYPDRVVKKFKARFCAHGDQQLKGVDFLCSSCAMDDGLSDADSGGSFAVEIKTG